MGNKGTYWTGIRLMLLKDFIEANAGPDKTVSRLEMSTYLKSRGYPAERKALYADLRILESEFDLQLEYDCHKKGYYLLNPPFETHELRLIVESVQAAKFITEKEAYTITSKVKKLARKDTVESLNRQVHVANRIHSMNDSIIKNVDNIHEAIASDLQISFQYFHYSPVPGKSKSYSKAGAPYVVSPYTLLWNNGNYYLYAYDGKDFRFFRVDRMENISSPLPDKREGQALYNKSALNQQSAKVFEMFNGPAYNVQIRFLNQLADPVIDQFGKGTIMIPVDKDHFTITVSVEISPPFFAWIASFGRRAKILSPDPVIQKMKEFLQRSADMYKDDGEK